MSRKKQSFNPILTIDQSYPFHEEYLIHLYNIFQNLTISGPKIVVRKPDIRTNKVYSSIKFSTRSLECLVPIYNLFYKIDSTGKLRKVVPDSISKHLTARSLAYWIIDDGHRTFYNQTVLNTNSYTIEEINILQHALNCNFQLRTRITEKTPGRYIIHIPVRQKVSLSNIVNQFIIDSIRHKIRVFARIYTIILRIIGNIKMGGYWYLFISSY